MNENIFIRPTTLADREAIEHLCVGSPWTMQHFSLSELGTILSQRPGVARCDSLTQRVQSFLIATSLVPPCVWLGGFGITWQDHNEAESICHELLLAWLPLCKSHGATTAYYSGYDVDNDWMRPMLQLEGFVETALLRSYDKVDFSYPTQGNDAITIRDMVPSQDIPALVAIEKAAFAPLWQHDQREFFELAAEYEFFVVAVNNEGRVVGYQFSTVDSGIGYLVRIAVDPAEHSQGIGSRLMIAAVKFFERQQVMRIL